MNLLICFVLNAVTMVGIGARCISHDCFRCHNDQNVGGEISLSGVRTGTRSFAVERRRRTFAHGFQRAVGATPEGESAVLTVGRDGTTVDRQ